MRIILFIFLLFARPNPDLYEIPRFQRLYFLKVEVKEMEHVKTLDGEPIYYDEVDFYELYYKEITKDSVNSFIKLGYIPIVARNSNHAYKKYINGNYK